jgi:hypothetical protein
MPTNLQEWNETMTPGMLIESKIGEAGSIGCFARFRNDASRTVILSASHVLYGSAQEFGGITAGNGSKVGQPSVSCCLCCACRVVATNTRNRNSWTSVTVTSPENATETGYRYDAAMAELNGERAYTNESLYGMISGAPSSGLGVQAGDAVEMVGSTSGRVTGTVIGLQHTATNDGQPVSQLLFPKRLQGDELEQFRSGPVMNILQLLILPDANPDDGTIRMSFGQHGDSGSAVVNAQGEVIGILSQVWGVPDVANTLLNEYLPAPPLPPHALGIGVVSPIGPVLEDFELEIVDNMSDTATASAVIDVNGVRRDHAEHNLMQKVLRDLERELHAKALGREALDALRRHRGEVLRLVDRQRRVTVTWHRNKGPAFAAHCMYNLQDHQYEIPLQVDGVSATDLLRRMAGVLRKYGSRELREDIERYEDLVCEWVDGCQNLWLLVERMRAQPDIERELAAG